MLGPEVLSQIATHGRARLAAVGIPPGVQDGLFARATSWDTWGPTWDAQGEDQQASARDLLRRGHHMSAGEAFHLAALFSHFGQLVLFHHIPTKDRLSRKREAAFRAGAEHLAPPARVFRVDTPGGGALRASLRLPVGRAGRAPCVEENLTFSDVLLRRGLAVVCLDGPGQGETRQDLPFAHDSERWVAPLVRQVAQDPAIDPDRLGRAGFSFGGYLAPRVAAFLPEIKACAVLGGCTDLSDRETLPALPKEDFAHVFGGRTWAEAAE